MVSDKVILVCGGATGIGRGVVDAALEQGAKVGVLDRNEEACAGLDAVVTVGDATTWEANRDAVAATVAEHGRLDALITVVGVWDYFTPLAAMDGETVATAFDELFGANVKSTLLAIRAATDALVASEGNVVMTLSNAAFYTAGGGALYTASKFAVRGLVHQLAYELAPKVRVNGVAPGGTPTPLSGLATLGQDGMHLQDIPDVDALIAGTSPLGVVPSPADHAPSYLFLASRDTTPAVTGTIIHSDGGLGVRGLTQPGGMTEPAPA